MSFDDFAITVPHRLTTKIICAVLYNVSLRKNKVVCCAEQRLRDQWFFDPITVPGRKPLVTLRDTIAESRTRCRRMAGRDAGANSGCRT
jgi:hypothetical protein